MKCLLCFFPEFCWEDVWNVKTPRSWGVSLDLVPPSKSKFMIFVSTFDDRTWVKVEDMTSFTEKSKVADSRRPGTSALFTSDSNFPSKHTNLPQKLQELSWQICYFGDPIWQEIHHLWCFLYIVWEKPVLPFFSSDQKTGLDFGPDGHCTPRLVTKALKVASTYSSVVERLVRMPWPFFRGKFCHVENHEVFPGLEEIRKGIGIRRKTLKFWNLVEEMENWFFQEDWDLKMKGFREGEVGKSLDKGIVKALPLDPRNTSPTPLLFRRSGRCSRRFGCFVLLGASGIDSVWVPQVKSAIAAMNANLWTRTERELFFVGHGLTSYFCWVFFVKIFSLVYTSLFGTDTFNFTYLC